MKIIRGIELKQGSQEELLPDFSPEFPYIASFVELHNYIGRQSPWHWHKEVELFYMKDGELEYDTPHGKKVFTAGMGGLVNANVLHMTRANESCRTVTAMLHIFDPIFISGSRGSAIDRKYVMPLITASRIDIIGLYPDNPEHALLLEKLQESFRFSEEDFGYEIRLRESLSDIWCHLLNTARPMLEKEEVQDKAGDKIKAMLTYVHEHYGERLTVAELAASAFISEREAYRVFRECVHLTPVEYIISYRLQQACHMLIETEEPITRISQACCLGSSSYFGKVFRERMGCSPVEFRRRWRNSDINRQE